jgi:xanthine dehydrogenase accessory factor
VDATTSWIETLGELRAAGRPCAVVVVTAVKGSVPREPGARMIVAGDEIVWGTIGGGRLEQQATEHAMELLGRDDPVSESTEVPLSEAVGQCCGGVVTLFYETHRWTRRRVAVFGAGHVGQALGALAPWLAADVLLVDGRAEDELRPRPPADRPYELLCVDAPEAELDELAPETLVVVMTHSHALDLTLLEHALRRAPFAFLGLIGSERKWTRFQKRLAQRGFDEDTIARVRCPIGVVKGGKDPRSIALSIATELAGRLERLPG